MLILGKRATGKSALIRKIITNTRVPQNPLDEVVIFTAGPTDDYSSFHVYRDLFDDNKFKHATFTLELLDSIVQRRWNRQWDRTAKLTLVFDDDCLFLNRNTLKEKSVLRLMNNQRSLRCDVIMTSQMVPKIPPMVLQSLDHVVAFKTSAPYHSCLYEFFPMFRTFDEFLRSYSQATSNNDDERRALMTDYTSRDDKVYFLNTKTFPPVLIMSRL